MLSIAGGPTIFGRDRSLHAFDKYTDLKAVMLRHSTPF
jgi:hypothetical protein